MRTNKVPEESARNKAIVNGEKVSPTIGFFLNPEALEVLKRNVFPRVFKQHSGGPLRVWVPGCSSGQVAYSAAIAFSEFAENTCRAPKQLQIFATDLNESKLVQARRGLYSRNLVTDLPSKKLSRFFVEEEDGYRVSKALRETVVFARHNPFSDPPFARIDLICCCNALMPSGPGLQEALPIFHYALKSGGFLFLGVSESIGKSNNLFELVGKRSGLYSRLNAVTPAIFRLPPQRARSAQLSPGLRGSVPQPMRRNGENNPGTSERFSVETNAQFEADRVTIRQFAPPGVLINADLQILQFRGRTSAFLEPPTGQASLALLKMARKGLMLPLRAAINEAKERGKTARVQKVRMIQSGQTRIVNIEVIPLKKSREQRFLVFFEEEETRNSETVPEREKWERAAELESELSEARDYLRFVQEQHEAACQELQASNEELQSANEELQSISEELETSKEELAAHAAILEQRVEERTKELDLAGKRLQGFAQKLVRSQEAERRSIARELHDEIGQQLIGLKLLLEHAGSVPGNGSNVFPPLLRIVAELQAQLRPLSFTLRQNVPDHITLRTVLECHFRQVEQRAKLKVHFECHGIKENQLGLEIRHTLFRIAQEALTNVVRHAKGREAWVSLSQLNGDVSIEVSDSGSGFHVETERAALSCGISGMEERVLLLGGQFFLTSHPGQGTRIRATLPCSASGEERERCDDGIEKANSSPEPFEHKKKARRKRKLNKYEGT